MMNLPQPKTIFRDMFIKYDTDELRLDHMDILHLSFEHFMTFSNIS